MDDIRPLIALKRDGGTLTAEQIGAFVQAAARGTAPDVQLASMLMAIFVRGLDTRERTDYALAMMRSGEVLNWDHLDRPTVDKHSTGGVGDKVSLIWAPLMTAAGFAVPMISGRGLGHTGGTLDKLEAIPGYRTDLSAQEMDAVLQAVGCVITGQTADLVPADRTLYALRSQTATVPTLDHIAPSIMSKKLAEAADTLVLDVKVGSGAFMKDRASARELADVMLAIGRGAGRRIAALITDMGVPLGRTIGNALEVQESIDVLRGGGPADLRALVLDLGEAAVRASGHGDAESLAKALDSGAAMEAFERMVEAQGGDPSALRPGGLHGESGLTEVVVGAPLDGEVWGIDALDIGLSAAALGGARGGDGSAPDPGVGIVLEVDVGTRVRRGDPCMRLLHRDGRGLEEATELARKALRIGPSGAGPKPIPLVLERLDHRVSILQSLVGIVMMLGLAWLLSTDRKNVPWRIIGWGLGLQFLFAVLVLKTPPGRWLFDQLNDLVLTLLGYTNDGSRFIFGSLMDTALPVVHAGDSVGTAQLGYIFAFQVLPTIIFFSSLMAVLYHVGVMQWLVRGVAVVMFRTMKTSGAETLSAAGNIFVGQTEAPLLVKPFIDRMTLSELMAIMTGGFATVAGGVMAAYVGMLSGAFPDIAGHLMAASVMSAPAALMLAKIMVPESETAETSGVMEMNVEKVDVNAMDAAARGASEGMSLALNVAAMLLAFLALVAMINGFVGWGGGLLGFEGLTLETIVGYVFWPLAWAMGVPAAECTEIGRLLGMKTILNEFVAYLQLAEVAPSLSHRSGVVATYALCGFANLGSIGIQLGGIGGIAPGRRGDLARIAFRAMLAGTLAAFLTANIAGMLIG